MKKTEPARRGRPRSFDRDEALRNAMQLFWAHGYEGTSMSQLVDAMGIGSPSIYAAFGAKDDLFREAVGLYVATEGGDAWQALSKDEDIQTAVRELLQNSISTFVSTTPPRGCLVVLGSSHLDGPDEKIRDFLKAERRRFRNRLVDRLNKAVEDGDLSPEADAEALAESITAFFSGISIAAADGTPADQLRKAAELFCDRLFGA